MSSSKLSLPDEVREVLHDRGYLPAEILGNWIARTQVTIEQAMVALLPAAVARAAAPVSGFHVGAVALGLPSHDGTGAASLYLGANLELRDWPLSMSIHAEQAAVNAAWLRGETGIQALAVTAPPCGYCRQFLWEVNSTGANRGALPLGPKRDPQFIWELPAASDLRILVSPSGANDRTPSVATLSQLLPQAFGPRDMGISRALMEPAVVRMPRQAGELADHARRAAEGSYAPYTGNYSGVSFRLASGEFVAGRVAENAAFNPSLSPLQSALSTLVLHRSPSDFDTIVAAALVEVPTKVSQRDATIALLRVIAPRARLEYIATSVLTADAPATG
jgi:cytidine deaminase